MAEEQFWALGEDGNTLGKGPFTNPREQMKNHCFLLNNRSSLEDLGCVEADSEADIDTDGGTAFDDLNAGQEVRLKLYVKNGVGIIEGATVAAKYTSGAKEVVEITLPDGGGTLHCDWSLILGRPQDEQVVTYWALNEDGTVGGELADGKDPRAAVEQEYFASDKEIPLSEVDGAEIEDAHFDNCEKGCIDFDNLIAVAATMKTKAPNNKTLIIAGVQVTDTFDAEGVDGVEIALPGGQTVWADGDFAAFFPEAEADARTEGGAKTPE